MDVFLVPVGREAYELYCEHVDEPDGTAEEAPTGRLGRLDPRFQFARLKASFHQMLLEAERERRQENADAARDTGLVQRVKRRVMRWVADSIAEQRLLWNLRRCEEAVLHHPHDIHPDLAEKLMKAQLTRDFEKHRFWLAIDSVLMVASGLLIIIPGPNIVGYYFAFRVVGHFFSVRGARNGLDGVKWMKVSSAPLTDLRSALTLDPDGRLRVAEAVATHLRLDHLATFFQRMAVSS